METLTLDAMPDDEPRLDDTLAREREGLWRFIRKRLPTREDAEDVLQDVLCELVAAYRVPVAIEGAGSWMFRVARNRIADWFRRKRPEATLDDPVISAEGEHLTLLDLLPSPDGGPEAVRMRRVLMERLRDALAELPADQRLVFVAHEVDGMSFNAIAAQTGENLNTLLSRKRYAVLQLRKRLQDVFDELRTA
jgi:RNA polymerase sigma factor (sigma-70 family)